MKFPAVLLALSLAACASAPSPPEPVQPPPGPPTPAPALPAPKPDIGLIDRYDEQALRSVATELGYTPLEARTNAAGRPAMSIEAGAIAFEITGESCEGEPKVCQGVQFSAQFVERDGVDADEMIARGNRTLRPAKLFRAGQGIVYERYLIMDGGVSRENLKAEMSVYVEILDVLFNQFNPSAEAEDKP